jgi:hypothetical protein
LPFDPRTCPTSLSDRHKVESTFNPTPINSQHKLSEGSLPIKPPGTANLSVFCSANKETILEKMGSQVIFPSVSFVTTPGRTSISSPSLSTPERILPPATPPLSSAISAPGLLTSKDRMTMRRGSLVKSRGGIGIRLTMYSLIASMLYLS